MPFVKKTPPKAFAKEHIHNIFGHQRKDLFHWLSQRDKKEVVDYLKAENTYTEAVLKKTEPLQKKIYEEIVDRIPQKDASHPYFYNEYWYYWRYEKGLEYPIHCRKKNHSSKEEILLDENLLSKKHTFFDLGSYTISPDNKKIAYSIDTIGRRNYIIYIQELDTGRLFHTHIENTTGEILWANDSFYLFYCRKDSSTLRSCEVYLHKIDNPSLGDKKIFYEADTTFHLSIEKSKSEKYIFIILTSTLSHEYHLIPADIPLSSPVLFHKREKEHEYMIDHFHNHFYILTNECAKNFRVMQTSEKTNSKQEWKELLPHKENELIEGIELLKNFIVVQKRVKGNMQLEVVDYQAQNGFFIPLKEPSCSIDMYQNYDINSDVLRYIYTSFSTPDCIMEYDIALREEKKCKQIKVLGGFSSSDYVTERQYAMGYDNISIPISLVYRKDMDRKKTHPLLLYAYGAYGMSMDPYFSYSRLSLLERGFVFAVAHVRGGQEMGREWYEDGRLLKKKNSFEDFISVARFLIEKKYTTAEQLFAKGGSAGGLLIGAVLNQSPELFQGAIAAVPFVDLVTTMLNPSIPLTTGEYDEWGDVRNKSYYDYCLSYSPYDNVEKKKYPHLLVTSGYHDSQVQYWEPAKWVAKLRKYKQDFNYLLLHTNMETGHSGETGRYKVYRELAREYAFLIAALETPHK